MSSIFLAQTHDIIVFASIWTNALLTMWTPVPGVDISMTYENHMRQGYNVLVVS
jgi:hypothetical protein